MKKTTNKKTPAKRPSQTKLNKAVQELFFQSQTLSRSMLSARLGTQFNGDRDLYKTFGYVFAPGYDEYKNLFDRQGLANRIVSMLAKDVWNTKPILIDGDSRSDNLEDGTTEFIKKWVELNERLAA